MKKAIAVLLALLLMILPCAGVRAEGAGQDINYQAAVYDTDYEGLNMKSSPDINSTRLALLPENTQITIDRVSGGWGHTSYNGQTGWVALTYTRVIGNAPIQAPASRLSNTITCQVYNTEGEGLELRTAPSTDSSTFGPVPEKTSLLVEAIQNQWAYTSYNGHYGWVHTKYLLTTSFQATVFDTENEGLALKEYADINSNRKGLIPEGTPVIIDQISGNWGHTAYGGQAGWVALRYTKVGAGYTSEAPTYGFISTVNYTVVNTDGEGLQLRTRPTVESSTFGPVPEGSVVSVSAIQYVCSFVLGHKR